MGTGQREKVEWQQLSLERGKQEGTGHTGQRRPCLGFQPHPSASHPSTYYLLLTTKKAAIGGIALDLWTAMTNETLVTQDN